MKKRLCFFTFILSLKNTKIGYIPTLLQNKRHYTERDRERESERFIITKLEHPHTPKPAHSLSLSLSHTHTHLYFHLHTTDQTQVSKGVKSQEGSDKRPQTLPRLLVSRRLGETPAAYVREIWRFHTRAMLRIANLVLAGLMVIVMLSHSTDAERQDIKVKYYAPCVLKCSENVTQQPDVRMFWILPDAVAIDHTTNESRLPSRLRFVSANSSNELNITRVDDDQFGYYTCVMINTITGEVMVTQWGVNIDGADFSALEAEYRHSAIIGAIAAAVMLAVVGGGCIIWHFRFSSRKRQGKEGFEDRLPAEDKSHRNQGFSDAGDIEVEMKAGQFSNGTASSTTATADGNVEPDEIKDHRL